MGWARLIQVSSKGFSLRLARVYKGCISTHGSPHHRNGVCIRNGDKGEFTRDEDRRGAYDVIEGWAVTAPTFEALAGWLAASQVHAPVQSAMAIFNTKYLYIIDMLCIVFGDIIWANKGWSDRV